MQPIDNIFDLVYLSEMILLNGYTGYQGIDLPKIKFNISVIF